MKNKSENKIDSLKKIFQFADFITQKGNNVFFDEDYIYNKYFVLFWKDIVYVKFDKSSVVVEDNEKNIFTFEFYISAWKREVIIEGK